MSEDRIEDRIKRMIVERCAFKTPPEAIGDEDSLYSRWKLESVKILELVVAMEEEFGIEFEDKEFTKANFETVARIASVVRSKTA